MRSTLTRFSLKGQQSFYFSVWRGSKACRLREVLAWIRIIELNQSLRSFKCFASLPSFVAGHWSSSGWFPGELLGIGITICMHSRWKKQACWQQFLCWSQRCIAFRAFFSQRQLVKVKVVRALALWLFLTHKVDVSASQIMKPRCDKVRKGPFRKRSLRRDQPNQ